MRRQRANVECSLTFSLHEIRCQLVFWGLHRPKLPFCRKHYEILARRRLIQKRGLRDVHDKNGLYPNFVLAADRVILVLQLIGCGYQIGRISVNKQINFLAASSLFWCVGILFLVVNLRDLQSKFD